MGAYIKGMEMPKEFDPDVYIELACGIDGKRYARLYNCHQGGLTDWCEVVHVQPHDGEAFEKVISERITQIEKWGDEPCNHPFEWMSILGEEFGELCEAVNETCFMNGTHPERGGDENIIREATQIAAVAIAIIREFSHTIIPAEEVET